MKTDLSVEMWPVERVKPYENNPRDNDAGVDICFELHPGEDLHDGVTFERFLDAAGAGHARTLIIDMRVHRGGGWRCRYSLAT